MSVKSRIQVLNKRLQTWLNNRGILATDTDTTTALVNKTINVPLTFNEMSLMPTSNNTTAPALNDEANNMQSEKGCWFPEQTGGKAFGFYSVVPSSEYEKAWPHVTTTYESTVQIPDLKLFVDASHSAEFNLCVRWTGHDDGVMNNAWLDDIVGLGDQIVDFPAPRTIHMADLGSYIANKQGHTNPPIVTNKVDLLNIATGQSKNYAFTPTESDIGGQRGFGNNQNSSEYLILTTFDLTKTPYLYYSINQPTTSGCTFALYTNDTTPAEGETYSAWYLGRDNSDPLATTPVMTKGGENYKGPSQWMYGPQTGCINLLDYIRDSMETTFQIAELKLYGYSFGDSNVTEATFNYLFLGSAPTNSPGVDWGEPAIPSSTLHNFPAIGGSITLNEIDYYVVGGYEDWTRLNAVSLARPYNYAE